MQEKKYLKIAGNENLKLQDKIKFIKFEINYSNILELHFQENEY